VAALKRGTGPRGPAAGRAGAPGLPAVAGPLAIFLAASYWPALSLVFIDDDYVMAGNGPAFRVGYRDTTLSGGYCSHDRPRPPEPSGPDYFFRFQSSGVWVEVTKGPEDAGVAAARMPGWEQDRRELALLLGGAGDWSGAAAELVKLADAVPDNFEYRLNAALCLEKLGDSLAAGRLYARAASLPGATERVKTAAKRFGRSSRSSH